MSFMVGGNVADVLSAVYEEREYQDIKWGTIHDHPHTVAEWLLVLESELEEAKDTWVRFGGDEPALHEIRQVAATALACLEQHGAPRRPEMRGSTP